MSKCDMCGIEFESKKAAKYCSPRCRQIAHRQLSVTDSRLSVTEPRVDVTDSVTFNFTTSYNEYDSVTNKKVPVIQNRTARYWYQVPLGARPVYQKDWPKMPEFMNGRQYFLWWKNEFKTNKNGEPIILNPHPVADKLEYVQAGETSRRWGA